ncbi:hypothetical protein [Bernardetia sp.]|uniref:hypothetical protein n=1 Tax=Bernardetia sp. TaxID=1937974 RepID=UPI0025B96EA9|nr:hypothetical protein [Bernardetia sp.]
MATRQMSINKHNFKTESEYFAFAKEVGKKIAYSKIRSKVLKLSAQKIRNANILISDYFQMYNSEMYNKQDAIADFIQKMPLKSFLRYSDKSHLTNKIEKNYICDEGVEADLQAKEMNEFYKMGITPDDIVEFIQNNEKGVKHYTTTKESILEVITEKFFNRYEIKINLNFVERYYAEFLQEKREVEQSDDCPF